MELTKELKNTSVSTTRDMLKLNLPLVQKFMDAHGWNNKGLAIYLGCKECQVSGYRNWELEPSKKILRKLVAESGVGSRIIWDKYCTDIMDFKNEKEVIV